MALNYSHLLRYPVSISITSIIVINLITNGVCASEQDRLFVPLITPTTIPTKTQPHHSQQTLTIQPRAAATSTIDFANVPTCVASECSYGGTSATSIPCASIPTPCPSGVGTNCSTFSQSCFCNLPTALECAFHPCGWTDVILMENWLNATCPNTDTTISSYSFPQPNPPGGKNEEEISVPSCARDCLHEQVIRYGCTSESKLCFCSHRKLFGCTATCSTADQSTIAAWVAATCQVSIDAANEIVAGDVDFVWDKKQGGPAPPTPPRPLHWYEKFGIGVFSITMGGLVVVAIVREWADKCSYFVGRDFKEQFPGIAAVAEKVGIKEAEKTGSS